MISASNGSALGTGMSYLPSVSDNKTINDLRARDHGYYINKEHSQDKNLGRDRISPLG